ncbi:hypothetical protein SNOG_09368 [Parastagonospora nodorum SN15]|uniref:Uncharacterized protein n=1 Tax=Phaeosphaeria nodorum (strain SN15 / ATCC MYA-4574 / FGSC 10173) TaxID=321614 RepID=Q0UFU6_PHANO|nr:hypothetical protein SNOG_09368 [Parastagonospora nodorum SN15]EAT83560.1 hypothetical protein SNOG_09368 [Parastagonospora nodorum SN15]
MPAKALRTHYKIKHLYNDMEPFKLERDKIKTLITPTMDPAWTKKRKEIIENLQAIHMIAYRDTTIRDPIRVMQIERLAIRAINGMLEEDNQRGFFIQGLASACACASGQDTGRETMVDVCNSEDSGVLEPE